MKNCKIFLSLAAATLFAVTAVDAVAQPAAGVYMIANSNKYNTDPAIDKRREVYYLIPAEQCYWNGSTVRPFFDTEDNGMPHLTTYQAYLTEEDVINALWDVQPVVYNGTTYYHFIHVLTGKYLTQNEMKTVPDGNTPYEGRLFVHLEATDTPGTNQLFTITDKSGGKFFITPYGMSTTYSLNPNGSNQPSKEPTSSRGGIGGTIGRGSDANSQWYFDVPQVTAPTVGFNMNYKIVMETIFPGATIYYTTDGSTPTTSSTQYNGPFDLPAGVTTINAIAVRSGYPDSPVTVFTPIVEFGDNHPYLIQNQGNTNFYLLPDQLNATLNVTKVTTNSLPRASMMWTMHSAGVVNGRQYYFIKNHTTGQYLCYTTYTDANNNVVKGVLMKDAADFDSSDIFRFHITAATGGGYNIIPFAYGASGGIFKDYDSANASYPNNSTLTVATPTGNVNDASAGARWVFVPVFNEKMPAVTPPITVSTSAADAHYYNIESGTAGYFMTPGAEYVTTTTELNDEAKWFFTVADSDDWNTYYYIQDVPTELYLGLRADDASMSNAAIIGELPASGSPNLYRYQFAIAPSAIAGLYYLVPRAILYQGNSTYYAVLARLDNTNLYTRNNGRSEPTMKWAFPQVVFQCATPEIHYDAATGMVTITCATTGATIYYTTDGSNPLTSSTRLTYSGPFLLESTYVNAVAMRNNDGSDASEVATFTMNQVVVSSTDEMTDMAGNYILDEGFVANGTVGTQQNPFTGSIDGGLNTFTVSAPLIGYANGAVISNVIISTATISGSGNIGAICNNALGDTRIYNCGVNDGSISGSAYTGGLVGLLDGTSRVVNCYNYADITGGTEVGGIVGHNAYASKVNDLRTMVMNCMFYGDITGGSSKAPIYNGLLITNAANQNGINNYNYFRYEAPFSKNGDIDVYNAALGAEERFLVRFEQYRQMLNSNRGLAAYYATGDVSNIASMAKWVLDKSIAPYPVLKVQGTYPSVINYDPSALTSQGTLTVTIQQGAGAPTTARIVRSSLTLTITDQDPDNYNFNYHKVQLPYYNEIGKGNYNGNKVVTGWKIVSITGGVSSPTSYSTGTDAPAYNFADRKCTDKDLYSVSGRVFAQGAYYDVPDSVTAITIEPYWAKCVYLSDPNWDVTYTENSTDWAPTNVTKMGTRYTNNTQVSINGSFQRVYTTMPNALAALSASASTTVFDNAIVLVGNFHMFNGAHSPTKSYLTGPFTILSADLDNDNEPDNSFIYQHASRQEVSPIRFDFLNIIGTGMAHKIAGSIRMPNVGIFQPRGWFEITNTCLFYFGQFEYDCPNHTESPLILEGGVFDQFVSAMFANSQKTQYIRIGSNAWFKMFNNGRHANKNYTQFTPHIPISVCGGDYDEFYLTGMFQPTATVVADNAECYITGGRFGEVAGAGMEQVKGNVSWFIDHADINNFYGGGVNAAKPITGNIDVIISDTKVNTYCGGPKFGDMTSGKTVETTATACDFGRYFGAGYGGSSFNRVNYKDLVDQTQYPFNEWVTTHYNRQYSAQNAGIAVSYEYEHLTLTGFTNNKTVGRFYVNYASLSLATTYNVTSSLTGCNIRGNFYGGGNLGKVHGSVTSTLTDCTVAGSVFGAGFSATIPTVEVYPIQGMNPEPYYNGQSGVYVQGVMPEPTLYTWHQVASVTAGNEFDESNHLIYTTADLTTLGQVEGSASLTIAGTTTVAGVINGSATGGVFGGGDASAVNGDTEVTIAAAATGSSLLNVYGGGNVADVSGSVTVAMTSGNVARDLYGGGAFANTNVTAGNTTTVNMLGGKVFGNVYGGGLGRKAAENVEEVYALVGGDVAVTVNGSAIGGSVFGCNNQNGTPTGNVLVKVLRTVNYADPTAEKPAKLADGDNEDEHPYELAAAYGGGNEAAYNPANDDVNICKVEVDGCGEASIGYVYGGGNAAPVNQCEVEIKGAYEIGYVFGGGNGANLSKPGADVGILDAAAYATDHSTGTYGPGNTFATIKGGTVYHVFGGSNTRGNIIGEALVTLGDEDTEHCVLDVGEVFSCGNKATMDGTARLAVSCVDSPLRALYGGAKQADVFNDVVLDINSGRINKVFGGNKTSGVIHGSITVNVEEKGCKPIIIDELYGGGDQAPYTSIDETGNGPFVNIRSCTSIGTVYGGGYGVTAVVTGNPIVDINMDAGYTTTDPDDAPANRVARPLGEVGTVFGGGNAAQVHGNPVVKVGTSGKSANITGNVFGGGNNADVLGNTHVEIGQ